MPCSDRVRILNTLVDIENKKQDELNKMKIANRNKR